MKIECILRVAPCPARDGGSVSARSLEYALYRQGSVLWHSLGIVVAAVVLLVVGVVCCVVVAVGAVAVVGVSWGPPPPNLTLTQVCSYVGPP